MADPVDAMVLQIQGSGRVRMALVAPLAECVEAADRIRAFITRNQ